MLGENGSGKSTLIKVLSGFHHPDSGEMTMNGVRVGRGVGSSSTTVAIRAMAIRAATPKNGPRQLMLPSVPPSSGPTAMPSPRAAS